MTTDWNTEEELKPLKLSCTSADCKNNLHCFKQTQKMKAASQFGQCRECGVELVDWSRVHKRCLSDATYTFDALKHELIRHHFWHVEIDQKAINHARRKGKSRMRVAIEHRLRKSVGPAEPSRDGRQTPKENSGNSIYYAQHATACCCRKCMEYWHNIPLGQALTDEEIRYFTDLVMLYINERLPNLTENGEKVPRLKPRRCEESSSTEDEGG
ncbi:MAG: DUF4186 family protein [Moorea sp. SIO2I5]|nr:DUF4186 family protein [Moorena sp. SIO2I5]